MQQEENKCKHLVVMFVEPIFMLECGTPSMCYTRVFLWWFRSPVSGSRGFKGWIPLNRWGFGGEAPKAIFHGWFINPWVMGKRYGLIFGPWFFGTHCFDTHGFFSHGFDTHTFSPWFWYPWFCIKLLKQLSIYMVLCIWYIYKKMHYICALNLGVNSVEFVEHSSKWIWVLYWESGGL